MNILSQNVLNDFILNLKKNKYKNKIQELKLEQCTSDGNVYIMLTQIKIKKSQRELGYGSAVLGDICVLADNYNVHVKLWASNIFGADLKRLYGFYRKHGFFLIENSKDGEMLYNPEKKREKL